MLWNGHRVPFTLIGGYLGAGKTTVLNHLLADPHGRRLTVLVNDVGAVNVDAALVAEHRGDTLALTNGCVCCAIADDLGMTLEQLRERDVPPDHVVMELSGVAEPARVAPWANTAGFRLDGIVVVADGEQIGGQVARSDVGDAVRAQLTAADLVIVSKADLAADGGADAAATIATVTDAPAVLAERGRVEPAVVLGIATDRTALVAPTATMPAHEVGIVHLRGRRADAIDTWVHALGDDVVRAKGFVRCTDREHPIEINVVGPRRTVRARPDLDSEGVDDAVVVIRQG